MPFEITLDAVPAGYSMSTGRAGETVEVAVREYVTSEDGLTFIQRLEGFPSIALDKTPPGIKISPAHVDHMLILFRNDQSATVYVNELTFISEVRPKRAIDKGDAVFRDDIADVRKLHFRNVEIPFDVGILFLFSIGWRKGLYYDFAPPQSDPPQPRDYDIELQLGQCYAHLLFQNRLRVSEHALENLLTQAWFPFISLSTAVCQELVNYANQGWDVDELVPKASEEVRTVLDSWLMKWATQPYFQNHIALFRRAAERYRDGDYESAVSIIFPRVEGVLRTFQRAVQPDTPQNQRTLVDTVVPEDAAAGDYSLLLMPAQFRNYLERVYFGAFDPKSPEGMSRHTVAHGVAPQEAFSEKAATIGFLILDQLSYCFTARPGTVDQE